MPLMTRRSSTRGLPGLPRGRCGSIAAQASLDSQNRRVITTSRLDEPNQKVESPNKAIDCIGSLPNPYHPERFWNHLGRAQYTARLYADAIASFSKLTAPDHAQHAFLAASSAQLGNRVA